MRLPRPFGARNDKGNATPCVNKVNTRFIKAAATLIRVAAALCIFVTAKLQGRTVRPNR